MMPRPDATDKPVTAEPLASSTLDELARHVRAALQASRQERCNALHHDLAIGDMLTAAQARVATGWKRWLRENCFLSQRTALLYQQLARHRAEIEAEITRVGELSLRAARRLIAEPAKKEFKPKPDLMVAWNKATPEELTRHLDAVTVMGLLRVISLAFRRELEGRLRKQKTEDEPEPHYQITMAFRTALGCLKIADNPQTSRAVALSQETAALNALRGLARMHPDFNGLSVGFREAKDPKRDPKADQKRRRAA
jgi:hypothetical protein